MAQSMKSYEVKKEAEISLKSNHKGYVSIVKLKRLLIHQWPTSPIAASAAYVSKISTIIAYSLENVLLVITYGILIAAFAYLS